MTSIPFYLESDVEALLLNIPYARFMESSGALRYWSALCSDAKELAPILRHYPHVRYAPLEPLYLCARAAASLDEHLVADLSTHWTWRGVVYAAFLCSLKPKKEYRKYLWDARERAPHNRWLVDLAICEIDKSPIDSYVKHQECLRELRAVVEHIPAQRVLLRPGPQQEELFLLRSSAKSIAKAYRLGGVSAARAAIDASPWKPFLRRPGLR